MIFIDRDKELKYLKSRILQFPLPEQESSRLRKVPVLIGPKGVGKTSLLKELVKQRIEHTSFVYVELRGPYESIEDILIDLLVQYHENIKEQIWKDGFERILKALGIKVLGKEVIETLTAPDNIELLQRSRPTLILRQLEEEACKMCEKDNTRLVIIYDEFQSFLKAAPIKERFGAFVDSFIAYFSKSQEWGFNSTKGYPIRILSTSDYTFYEMMSKYLTSYLEEKYIEELSEEQAMELLRAQLGQYGLESDELADIYAIKAVKGNPSIICTLTSKLKERNKFVAAEDVEEVVEREVVGVQNSLKSLNWPCGSILEGLLRTAQQGKEWVTMEELSEETKIREDYVKEGLKHLLLANAIQIHAGKVAFQNKLIQYAAGKL